MDENQGRVLISEHLLGFADTRVREADGLTLFLGEVVKREDDLYEVTGLSFLPQGTDGSTVGSMGEVACRALRIVHGEASDRVKNFRLWGFGYGSLPLLRSDVNDHQLRETSREVGGPIIRLDLNAEGKRCALISEDGGEIRELILEVTDTGSSDL